MNNLQMRREVARAYDAEKWRKKVEKMSDAQVIAVYLKMKKDGLVK